MNKTIVFYVLIVVFVLSAIGCDSDYKKLSGSGHGAVTIFTDPDTGVQYLSCFGKMTPRLDSNGDVIVNPSQ